MCVLSLVFLGQDEFLLMYRNLKISKKTNVSETESDICTKNNYITRFDQSLLNTISYITNHLKYITLIMKN